MLLVTTSAGSTSSRAVCQSVSLLHAAFLYPAPPHRTHRGGCTSGTATASNPKTIRH